MNNIPFSLEHAKENVLIDGKKYSFIIFVSEEDCSKLIELLKHTPNYCRQAIANYIRTKLDISEDQKPSMHCIATQDNNFFAHIFELICRDDETLKKLYDNNIDDPDIFHRFITSLNARFGDNLCKQFAPPSISKVQISQIPNITFEVSKSLNYEWNKISEIAANSCTNTNNVFYEFTHWYDNIQYSFDIINQIGSTFSEFLQSIYVPKLSDERKEQLRNSHEIWGKLGWTQPPFAPSTFFDTPPIDQKDANKKALKYCTRTHMEKLFSALLDLSHAKKSDINEAILTFNNKQYKSCALILFP